MRISKPKAPKNPKLLLSLQDKMKKAERTLTSSPIKRRTPLGVKFDKRWVMQYDSPNYISLFFRIPISEIVKADKKWKDLVMETIQARNVDNLDFIPDNNVDHV